MANVALTWKTKPHHTSRSRHTVKFFDSDDQRLQSIKEFVTASLCEHAVTLVIAPAQYHLKLREEAERLALRDFHLELLDADHVMCQLLAKKEVTKELFDSFLRPHVMSLVKLATDGTRPIRIYGDAVNSLCELGYEKAAIALEAHWHELIESLPPTIDCHLTCGYLLENLGAAKSSDTFEKICCLHHQVVPLLNENSSADQSIGYLKAKIRQQDRALRREIAEQERLQAMGEMSATVSHELANPLTTLIYSIERLENWVAEQPLPKDQIEFLQNHLGRARRSSNKLNDVNRNVLNLSRANSGTSEVFLLQSCVETTTSQIAYRILEQGIQLRVEVPDAKSYPIFVNGSRTSIEQVLTNLLINAADSIIERLSRDPNSLPGKIEILVDRRSRTEVYIYVTDNGLGVAPEAKDQIFQSFFTTKPLGKGTGIGLTFSQKVVRKHGGDLEYIEKPDPTVATASGGACFRIRLPVTEPRD